MTMNVATQVLATVNAPYGADLSAHQLAAMIADPKSASNFEAPVFSFFSEVALPMQKQFIAGMGVDAVKATQVADEFSKLSGYALPLAA
ncbi:MAG TPA: hypothetical protein VMG08_01510 [Allosphingosinicella sp.]|nr:hypothetical protein [Allosphingosinicella sp.]